MHYAAMLLSSVNARLGWVTNVIVSTKRISDKARLCEEAANFAADERSGTFTYTSLAQKTAGSKALNNTL